MKISKVSFASFILTGIVFLSFFQSVNAQTITSAVSITPGDGKGARVQAWCQKIVPAINTRITNASSTLTKRQQWVATRKQKIQDRIIKLQSKGANVTQLTTDSQTFSSMMDKWVADFQTVITDLKATQQYTCGDAQGKFAQAVKTARTQTKTVKQDGQAMKSFYQSTIKTDIQTATQQVKQTKGTVTPSVTH